MHTAWPGQGGGLPAEGQHAAQTTAPGDGYLMPQQQMQQQQQQQQQQRQLQQRRALPQSMPYPPQVLPPAPIQPYPPYPYPQLVPWGVPLPFEGPPAIPPVPLAFNAPPLMHPPPPYPTPYALPPQLPPHLTDSGPLERKLSGSKRVYADLGATTPVSHQPSRVRMGQYALSGLGGSSAGLPAGPTDYTNQLTLCEPLDWAEQKAAERSDGAPYLAALTRNIINTVNALQPTPGDVAARAALMRVVEAAATYALPEFQGRLQVLPFGSFVSGLGTKASDIDVVIVGVREPQNRKGFYDRSERPDVARILDRVGRSLRNMFKNEISIVNFFLIRTSRIPVLKVSACLRHPPPEAQGYQNRPISVDISATTAAGPQAARYIAQQAQTFKALRPIVLIVKAFLKVSNLNDVSTGGLSSFGLTLMVLAHLLDEKKAGNDVEDLGYMLHWFFKRYGTLYDPARMAVSVRHGGTVPRQTVDALWDKKLDRICCIDPLTGLDCTEGTYRAEEVLEAFARADQQLAKLAARHAESCPPDLDILAKLSQLASGQLDDEEEEEELLAEIDQSNDEDEAAQGAGVPEQQANKLPSPHELLGLSDEGNQAPPPQQQYHTQPPLRHQHQRSNREQQGSSSSESSESDGSVQGNGEAATAGNDSGACHGDAAQGRGAEAALSSSRTQEGGESGGGGSRGRGSGVSEQGSKGGGMGRRKSGPPSRGAQAELVGLTRHNSAPIGVNEVPGASGAASRDAGGSGSNKVGRLGIKDGPRGRRSHQQRQSSLPSVL